MAMMHVSVGKILKGRSAGGAEGFAVYIAREQMERGAQHSRYLVREPSQEKHDLVCAGSANLPAWAQGPTHFFSLADRHEREGGIVARTYEIALPRELAPMERKGLADDIRATFWNHHPHAWAMHNPVARDGQEQPHLHVMVNERVVDGIARGPARFFKQAASWKRDPALGGARKDLSWNAPTRIAELRAGVATLTNAALEWAGHDVAVSGETLQARRYNREPEQDLGIKGRVLYTRHGIVTEAWQRTLARREVLRRDYYPLENAMNVVAWQQQKTREQIHDVSREAMVDHVRDKFWLHDRSPQREQERQASFARTVARQWPLPHEREPSDVPRQRGPARASFRHRPRRLWDRAHGLDDTMQHGVAPPMAHDLEQAR